MEAVQLMLNKLRRTYISELPTRLDDIERQIIGLERRGYQEENFNQLFRHVHSLKGSGGTHGLHIVTAICHPLEDYLSSLPATPEKIDSTFANIALAYVDLLREASTLLEQENPNFLTFERKLKSLRLRAFAPPHAALIVDNSRLTVNLLANILQSQGFRVVVLDDGYVALGRALGEPFDLLITSQEVKHLPGNALIAALRLAQGGNCRTKTMLLTVNKALEAPSGKPDFVIAKDAFLTANLAAALESVIGNGG